ncbi:hypothetical protein K438DRAFT_1963471 [Mycena galopus ATCC 62051]|nr:hypothetical protein K438DRAFT_1963471 [Mycena galopus ATCC 62051]
MSDEPAAPEIQINVKGPSELKLQITIALDKTVLELKQAIAEKSDVEAARQRLIYSGRVLKDEDLLSVYKIQSSHTIHMVKGAARSGTASTSAQPTAPQALPTMQTGQNPHDPLTQLNSHMGFGAMAGLNPFADMGLNANDPNMVHDEQPTVPAANVNDDVKSRIMDQIIASNPQMAGMGPEARAMMQSDHFRQMVSSPENLQRMLQMASMFNGTGGGGAPAFPAPGIPGQPASASTPTAAPAPAFPNLFGGAGAGAGGGAPPFNPALLAALMGGAPPTTPPAAGAFGAGASPAGPAPDLGAMYNLFGAAAQPPPPADSRPPEERFQVQLQQLQDMGFTNASQNVRALLATAGNVHSAIEYILTEAASKLFD